jgi:hypothetical protein
MGTSMKKDKHDDSIPLRYLGDLQRIMHKPGDVFVLTTNQFIPPAAREAIKQHWAIAMPDTKLLVLENGMHVGVLSRNAWIGCGECDVSFKCHQGMARCIRNEHETGA